MPNLSHPGGKITLGAWAFVFGISLWSENPSAHGTLQWAPGPLFLSVLLGWAELELGQLFPGMGAGLAPPSHTPGVPACLMCSHGLSPAAGHTVLKLCHSQRVVCLGRVSKSNLESIGGQGGREGRGKEGI